MWIIGFAILVTLYVFAIKLFISTTRSPKVRKVIIYLSVFLPLIYPFLFYTYPSYQQFKSLCKADDRKIINTTKSVNYIYLGKSSMCYRGFEFLSHYKGIECEYSPKMVNDKLGNDKGVFRYIRGGNWSDSSCVNDCRSDPNKMESESCKLSCMQHVNIDKFTNAFTINSSDIKLIEGRLVGYERRIIDTGVVMGVTKNYFYYPYGNTWAKILGLSSGVAPRLSCDEYEGLKNTDIYKAKR